MAAAALAFVFGSASLVHAAKTDVIVLRNGDHLTGEVKTLREGKLQVNTDDIGTLSIEWDKVVSVTTAGVYEVTLRDGTHLLGRLTPATAGSLQVVADDGSATRAVMAEIVSVAEIKRKFLDRIDGSFDLGGSYTKSSGVAELFFDTEARYRRPSYAYNASFSTNLTQQENSPDSSRYALQVGYTRFRNNRWVVSSFALFEGNEDLGFTIRGTGDNLELGYVVSAPHVELLLSGGMALGREKPVEGGSVTNVDALVAADLAVFAYDFPTTRLDLAMLVFPSLDDPGRLRVNANGKFKRELFRDFYFSVTAYDAFDNRPKAGAVSQNDFGGSLSFGWSF